MLSERKFSRELTRFLRFSVVGVIGAIIDFGLFNILNSWLGVWSVVASIISFIAAVTSNFIWNRYWTYPDSRSKPVRRQLVQFFVVSVGGLVIRTTIFALAEEPFIRFAEDLLNLIPSTVPPGSDSFLPIEAVMIGSNLALALAVVVVMFWNFGINRIWTYSDVE